MNLFVPVLVSSWIHRGKVTELSLRCEELQKHVEVLQSGEEVQGSQRKVNIFSLVNTRMLWTHQHRVGRAPSYHAAARFVRIASCLIRDPHGAQ